MPRYLKSIALYSPHKILYWLTFRQQLNATTLSMNEYEHWNVHNKEVLTSFHANKQPPWWNYFTPVSSYPTWPRGARVDWMHFGPVVNSIVYCITSSPGDLLTGICTRLTIVLHHRPTYCWYCITCYKVLQLFLTPARNEIAKILLQVSNDRIFFRTSHFALGNSTNAL